jgi:hypothetical protein
MLATSDPKAGGPIPPVLLLVFNRPDTTKLVFERIRQARPRQLFIAADGPRSWLENEAEQCAAARAVTTRVDWDCQVKTLMREENLGCKRAVASAIDWFFEQVSEGIILEDDTLPGAEFFPFCAWLLEHFRNDPRVMHIGGNNFQFGRRRGDGAYYFSVFTHVWGWATWRRAWRHYDSGLSRIGELKRSGRLERIFKDRESREFWLGMFEMTARGEIDTWDSQWIMSIWNQGGLAVQPEANLVTNIGFGPSATHTKGQSRVASLPVRGLGRLCHPSCLAVDQAADDFSQRYVFFQHINDPERLARDVTAAIEAGDPREAAALAGSFLTLYPQDAALAWLELKALDLVGDRRRVAGRLEKFLALRPEHAQALALRDRLAAGAAPRSA